MFSFQPNDELLWNTFSSQNLSAEKWNHIAHLRLAFLFNSQYSIDEAHLLMRAGIIKLNAAHGHIESPTKGYHETMTRVW